MRIPSRNLASGEHREVRAAQGEIPWCVVGGTHRRGPLPAFAISLALASVLGLTACNGIGNLQNTASAPIGEQTESGGSSSETDDANETASETTQEIRATEPKGSGDFDTEYTFDGQININMNRKVKGEGFEFTLEDVKVLDEVRPEDPEPGSTYFYSKEGYTLVAVCGTMKNTSDDVVNFGRSWLSPMNLSILPPFFIARDGQPQYGGEIIGIEPDGSDVGAITVSPGSSAPFMILCTVPVEEVGSVGGSKMFMSFDRDFDDTGFGNSLNGTYDTTSGGDYVYCLTLPALSVPDSGN